MIYRVLAKRGPKRTMSHNYKTYKGVRAAAELRISKGDDVATIVMRIEDDRPSHLVPWNFVERLTAPAPEA